MVDGSTRRKETWPPTATTGAAAAIVEIDSEQVLPAKTLEQDEHFAGRQPLVPTDRNPIDVQRARVRDLLLQEVHAAPKQRERHDVPCKVRTGASMCAGAAAGGRGRAGSVCLPGRLRASPQLLEDADATVADRAGAHA